MDTDALARCVVEHLAATAECTVADTGSTVWRVQQSIAPGGGITLIELDEARRLPTGRRLTATISVAIDPGDS